MKRHPLLLVPTIATHISGVVGIYLRRLELSIWEYESFWEGFPKDIDPPEHEVQGEEFKEQEMVKAIAICLHLLNESLLTKLLIEKYRFSEESTRLYLEEAKEIMDKNIPV